MDNNIHESDGHSSDLHRYFWNSKIMHLRVGCKKKFTAGNSMERGECMGKSEWQGCHGSKDCELHHCSFELGIDSIGVPEKQPLGEFNDVGVGQKGVHVQKCYWAVCLVIVCIFWKKRPC